MPTKSQLQTQISTLLPDANQIPSEDHRQLENYIADILYPNLIIDSDKTSVNVFQAMQPNMTYSMQTRKLGNIVFVRGTVTTTSSLANNGVLFKIIDSEYISHTSSIKYFQMETLNRTNSYLFNNFSDGNLTNNSGLVMPAGSYYIEFFYFVNS